MYLFLCFSLLTRPPVKFYAIMWIFLCVGFFFPPHSQELWQMSYADNCYGCLSSSGVPLR